MQYDNHQVTGLLSPFVDETRLTLVGREIRPGASVLEIGCGNGMLLAHLPAGVSYTGCELNAELVEWLRVMHPMHTFFVWDAAADPLPAGRQFDVAVMAAFIEHIDAHLQGPLLRNVRRVLTPGGTLILTTPTAIGGAVHKVMAACGLVSREAAQEHKGFLGCQGLETLLASSGYAIASHRHYLCGMAHLVTARG